MSRNVLSYSVGDVFGIAKAMLYFAYMMLLVKLVVM